MDRNGEFYHLPTSRDVQGGQRERATPQWLLRALPSSLGNILCCLPAVIDSSSLIKQKQQDSFLLKVQATIIFQKWILPAFTEDKHSEPLQILISDFESALLSCFFFFFFKYCEVVGRNKKRQKSLLFFLRDSLHSTLHCFILLPIFTVHAFNKYLLL